MLIDLGASDMPAVADLAAVEKHTVQLVRQAAGRLVGPAQRQVTVDLKDGDEPVTELDRSIERAVIDGVLTAFPDHAVLGEEFGFSGPDSEWLWIIDPIDGTWNFINGLPMFAVSLGVLFRGVPVAAATALPGLGRLLHARAGGALHSDGRPVPPPAASDRRARPDRLPTGVLPPHLAGHLRIDPDADGVLSGDHRWLGSTATEMAMIALGRFEFGVFHDTALWDVASGVLLIAASGRRLLRPGTYGSWAPFTGFDLDRSGTEFSTGPLMAGTDAAMTTLERLVHPSGGRATHRS